MHASTTPQAHTKTHTASPNTQMQEGEERAFPEKTCLSLTSVYESLGFLVSLLGTLLTAVTIMQVCSGFQAKDVGTTLPQKPLHRGENTGFNLAL